MFKVHVIDLVLLLLLCSSAGASFYLRIQSSGSAVLGSEIQFTAELYKDGKLSENNDYKYYWRDDAKPKHIKEEETKLPFSNWSIIYPKKDYQPGVYRVDLIVQGQFIFWYELAKAHFIFELKELLTGNLTLIQNGTQRPTEFVSTATPVNHTIHLRDSDYNYLKTNTTYMTTYWFQNCVYMGQSSELSYFNLYNKENEEYEIEALVIGSFDKLPEPITTTTTTTTTTTPATTTTTTTTTTTPTTSTTTTTTSTPVTTTTKSSAPKLSGPVNSIESSLPSEEKDFTTPTPKRARRNANSGGVAKDQTEKSGQTELEVSPYGVEIDVKNITRQLEDGLINQSQIAAVMSPPEAGDNSSSTQLNLTVPDVVKQPFVCFNQSQVAPDPSKVYGYFRRKIVVKAPVANLSISGSNWLQHGDVLNLQAKCTGSPPLEHCIKIFSGPYNVTGNETCLVWQPLSSCEFPFTHYFQTTQMHSVVFVVRNPVAKVVNQVAVNFYEAKKQSQLSVIVVPVSFSLVAVILVVFGVAYYIQNKNRFIVEVADFNFGETASVDMEYKTFQQRLVDSIREVLHRPHRNSDVSSGSVGESSLKYGSMT